VEIVHRARSPSRGVASSPIPLTLPAGGGQARGGGSRQCG
jgi:hypothetical protein